MRLGRFISRALRVENPFRFRATVKSYQTRVFSWRFWKYYSAFSNRIIPQQIYRYSKQKLYAHARAYFWLHGHYCCGRWWFGPPPTANISKDVVRVPTLTEMCPSSRTNKVYSVGQCVFHRSYKRCKINVRCVMRTKIIYNRVVRIKPRG